MPTMLHISVFFLPSIKVQQSAHTLAPNNIVTVHKESVSPDRWSKAVLSKLNPQGPQPGQCFKINRLVFINLKLPPICSIWGKNGITDQSRGRWLCILIGLFN